MVSGRHKEYIYDGYIGIYKYVMVSIQNLISNNPDSNSSLRNDPYLLLILSIQSARPIAGTFLGQCLQRHT